MSITDPASFFFIILGCLFIVVLIGVGILLYYITPFCRYNNESKSAVQLRYNEDPKICFLCGEVQDRFGSGHYNCTMD